ncbi:MAG: PASTA domain-containing protein [bacterium]|nr:PASTA domain-containing protein [bacterium]
MAQLRASRLNDKQSIGRGFLTDFLPYGTPQRRLTFWLGIPILILFIVYLLMNNWILPSITRHGTEFPLPDFTNQALTEVQFAVEDLGLSHEVASYEYSPGKEKGIILNQFPIAGTKVKRDRVIKFVLSQGQKLLPIPDMAGRSVRQAMLDLEATGLILGEIAWAISDTLPERVVVFSYPAAGTEIPLGSPVNLMVNRGRATDFTYMPKLTGLTLTDAEKRLEDKYLKLGLVSYRIDENYLPETVLEQSEAEGNELDVNTEIDVVVSSTE